LNHQIIFKTAIRSLKTKSEKGFGKKKVSKPNWAVSGLSFSSKAQQGLAHFLGSHLQPPFWEEVCVDAGAKMRTTDLRRPPSSSNTLTPPPKEP
jgi:hypothetical protein